MDNDGLDSTDLAIEIDGVTLIDEGDFLLAPGSLYKGLTIVGSDGDDHIRGTLASDILIGGFGKDILVGGEGADTFVFHAGDSGVGGANRDVIKDFKSGTDKIDLTSLSADASYIIEPHSGASGGFLLKIDSDGDGICEMHIQVYSTALFNTDILI